MISVVGNVATANAVSDSQFSILNVADILN